MNWLWILTLAGLGVLMAALNIFGVVPSSLWLSVGLALVAALGLGYNVKHKLFLHGFLTAVIWTLAGGAVQFLFWDTMIANHPEVQEKLAQVPEGMNMKVLMTFGIVVTGLAWGAVLGVLAMLAGKLLAEKPAPEPVMPAEVEQHDTTGK
jgi:hypothetical protein